MKFSTPQFFKTINQERKYLSRLFTAKKILAFLNTFFFLVCTVSLWFYTQKHPAPMPLPQLLVVIGVIFILGLNTLYFFYAWHLNRTRIHLEKCWDPVTGAWNESYFEGLLQEEIAMAGRYHYPLSLCLLSVDNFKSYEENFGKRKTNELLGQLSTLIRGGIRSSDLLGCAKEDEFFLLFPHTDIVRAEKTVARLSEQATDHLDCTFRAGITTYCVGETKSQLKIRTAAALDHAKRAGNKRIMCLVGQQEGQAVLEF